MPHTQIDAWRVVRQSTPNPGDVIVSERSARADMYEISLVPGGSEEVVRRYSEALERGSLMARRLGVDAWYTCDQTHYVLVARHRLSSGDAALKAVRAHIQHSL